MADELVKDNSNPIREVETLLGRIVRVRMKDGRVVEGEFQVR